jgi:hypothetical protein
MAKHQPVYIIVGLALIFFAILPTPDDVVIISPIVQLFAGIALLIKGIEGKKGFFKLPVM